MARFAHRHSDGINQFNAVMGAMRSAPDLVELGKDTRGEDRFTTRAMIEAEQRLHRAAELMAEQESHEVNDADRQAALARAEGRVLVLSGEQADALAHVTDGHDLGVVVGHAGTGKSAMLGWRGRFGRRPATRSEAWRCPALRRKISKADRALRRAPSLVWNMAGTRAATCFQPAMCW